MFIFHHFCQFWLWLRDYIHCTASNFATRPWKLATWLSKAFSTNLVPVALRRPILWLSISWLQVICDPNGTCWTPAYNFNYMSVVFCYCYGLATSSTSYGEGDQEAWLARYLGQRPLHLWWMARAGTTAHMVPNYVCYTFLQWTETLGRFAGIPREAPGYWWRSLGELERRHHIWNWRRFCKEEESEAVVALHGIGLVAGILRRSPVRNF